jgi:hypothetical protein
MISPEYDFEQFVEASKKKDVYEIIYLAEQEAIGAWRRSYQSKTKDPFNFIDKNN